MYIKYRITNSDKFKTFSFDISASVLPFSLYSIEQSTKAVQPIYTPVTKKTKQNGPHVLWPPCPLAPLNPDKTL